MRNKTSWTAACIGLAFSLGVADAGKPRANATDWPRNVVRVKTGIFEYRDSNRGKKVGSSTITIQRLAGSGNLSFINKAEFSDGSSGFQSQRWEAVATPEFRPILAKLAFLHGDEVVPVFEVRYGFGRATGFLVSRKSSPQRIKQTIDALVPEDIVDQRIDWAAILASDLETGGNIEFNVFDPSSGVSRVTAEVGPSEELRVPAGTFSAVRVDYQIEKLGRTERYRLFVARNLPHMMLREDFSNGVVAELVRVRESDPRR